MRIAFRRLLIIALCLLLASCLKVDQEPIFTPLPSSPTATIRPTLTEAITPGLPPTIENTQKPMPTQFVDTYLHKEVWISYEYASGVHYEYEAFLGIRNFPN